MARISAQVILRTADNIPANYATNTYFFDLDTDPGAGNDINELTTDEVAPALIALYNDLNEDGDVFGGLQLTGHRIKFVDVDAPKPQYPYQEVVWDFSVPVSVNQLPHEVCIVSSFEAEQVAGINQATRRGRVFLGPLGTGTMDPQTGRVGDTDRAAIATAFSTFASNQDTAGFSGWRWMVYSRKNDAMAQVVMGHVDNAFDTQRRRGVSSTARSVWSS